MKLKLFGSILVSALFVLGATTLWAVQPARAAITPVHVKIVDFAFNPSTITVVIGVNNTVIWTNDGTATHTATADGGAFDSGPLTTGESYSFTFSAPGTYAYHCSIHAFMTGTVHVLSPANAATSSSFSSSSALSSSSFVSSSSSSTGGQSIPEFPVLLGLAVLVAVIVAASYVFAERRSQNGELARH